MNLILDTHFLLWVLLGSKRLAPHGWLERHRPWGVSPVSLLEIQFLSEVGHVDVRDPEIYKVLQADPRFAIDEVPLLALITKAISLDWTRDPFDRLLAAHSLARRVPLCTLDANIRRHHPLLPSELPSSASMP